MVTRTTAVLAAASIAFTDTTGVVATLARAHAAQLETPSKVEVAQLNLDELVARPVPGVDDHTVEAAWIREHTKVVRLRPFELQAGVGVLRPRSEDHAITVVVRSAVMVAVLLLEQTLTFTAPRPVEATGCRVRVPGERVVWIVFEEHDHALP